MVDKTLEQILLKKFNYRTFRPGQEEAILAALQSQDSLVMLPTGSGKSICYQLPGYMKEGLVVIVSPLLSLMQDQVEKLKANGERQVAALNSLSSRAEKNRIFKQLHLLKFLYISPEMIQFDFLMQRLKQLKIALFVVDEAHCISQWGMDFRPDYLKMGEIRRKLNNPTTMALTATATESVRNEIKESLHMNHEETQEIIHSVDRKAIKLKVAICDGNKKERLTELVNQLKGAGVIYFSSKKLADEIAETLRTDHGLKAESYHSDLTVDDKVKVQQQFIDNTIQLICATSAFGMGIDKPDIRFVIHYHMPANPEMYLQEIGRCSRDGKEGIAILLFEAGDQYLQMRLQENALPDESLLNYIYKNNLKIKAEQADPKVQIGQFYVNAEIPYNVALYQIQNREKLKQNQLDYMLKYVYHTGCKRAFLLHYFDEAVMNKPANCCSSCDPSLEQHFFSEDIERTNKNTEKLDWKTRFKQLYKIDEESMN
ncbi:RecQ family ATP-dependent DNA helicase [Marinilactibacillus kalidii]|uniref:RecQ family ATP-dependent DNA helicase n=1 Tax=Marinilactibacillus kalidii TaxID=2820274 RepID=UPI001ABE2CFE|nr:RecQ family ATP-dependent DNA helicase [Marinilactibacillus kalidii]